MIKTAGLTFDFYDDGGETLRKKLQGRAVPEFIKTAAILQPEEIESLPDHAFAVVLLNDGTKMRKYACVDKGNVAVNTIYFLEHHDTFPIGVQVKTAANLIAACDHFGLAVPEQLQKIAEKKKLLIQMDGAGVIADPTEYHRSTAELVGVDTPPTPEQPRVRKMASVMEDPYVDITRDVELPKREEAEGTEFAIVDRQNRGHFPLRTYGEVKMAVDYFAQNGHRLHPRKRHSFCVKVAAKADALGIQLPEVIQKYGSTMYGHPGEVEVGVQLRKQLFRTAGENEGESLLDTLLEKRASFDPEMFAETVAQLDVAMGIDKQWDKSLPDPWYMTFGMPKVAEWAWQHGNEKLKEDQLRRLVGEGSGREALKQAFGDEIADSMVKNATGIFDSLPLDKQIVIARMAQQQDSGL